jgi:hypothetical protein
VSPPDGAISFPRSTEESDDLHADAMRAARGALPALTDIGEERRGVVDTGEIERFNHARRTLLGRLVGAAGAGLALTLLAPPARADIALDIQILQTASALEAVAAFTYGVALGEGPEGPGAPAAVALATRPDVARLARDTQRRHAEHRKAFQSQTVALGGRAQDSPHPRFLALASGADLSTPAKVVDFATTLEKVATDTYLLNLALIEDSRTRALMAGVMAVEAQHLATLRLLAMHPTPPPFAAADLARLPSSAGRAPFPDALHAVSGPDLVADPASGALR